LSFRQGRPPHECFLARFGQSDQQHPSPFAENRRARQRERSGPSKLRSEENDLEVFFSDSDFKQILDSPTS
jgi:hypothetical protein